MLETHAQTSKPSETVEEAIPETLTIFRRYPDGDVIALFPEDDWGNETCGSYMRVGQHGGADYSHVIGSTKKCSPFLYESLRQELTSIGYNLLIRQKWMRRRKPN